MIRYLPIVMLAFGLVLLSATFVGATPSPASRVASGPICEDVVNSVSAPHSAISVHKVGRCWKKMGLGILIPSCKVHVDLSGPCATPEIRASRGWAEASLPAAGESQPPGLDLPPPRL